MVALKQTNTHSGNTASPPSPNEQIATERIQAGIDAARREQRLIDLDIARLIAASVHRGLAHSLERFAATGRIPHNPADYQVMRLELDLATQDEPQLTQWATVLKEFFRVCAASRVYLDHQNQTNTKPPKAQR